MDAPSRLLLIEGIPGTGKSSLAAQLAARLTARGDDVWHIPELERPHPVVPRDTMKTAAKDGFATRCATAVARFAARLAADPRPRAVLAEGCFFQSTVRLLVEYDRAEEAETYLAEAEDGLRAIDARLVVLRPADTERFLLEEAPRRKDIETLSRITAYSETTPFSRARGWRGSVAWTELYLTYAELCAKLVSRSRLPSLVIDPVASSEEAVAEQVEQWWSQPRS